MHLTLMAVSLRIPHRVILYKGTTPGTFKYGSSRATEVFSYLFFECHAGILFLLYLGLVTGFPTYAFNILASRPSSWANSPTDKRSARPSTICVFITIRRFGGIFRTPSIKRDTVENTSKYITQHNFLCGLLIRLKCSLRTYLPMIFRRIEIHYVVFKVSTKI